MSIRERSPSGVMKMVLIDVQSAGRQVESGGPPHKLRLTPRRGNVSISLSKMHLRM